MVFDNQIVFGNQDMLKGPLVNLVKLLVLSWIKNKTKGFSYTLFICLLMLIIFHNFMYYSMSQGSIMTFSLMLIMYNL